MVDVSFDVLRRATDGVAPLIWMAFRKLKDIYTTNYPFAGYIFYNLPIASLIVFSLSAILLFAHGVSGSDSIVVLEFVALDPSAYNSDIIARAAYLCPILQPNSPYCNTHNITLHRAKKSRPENRSRLIV